MAEKKFSKEHALRFGWDRMKNNLGFFIVYLIILFIVEWFFSMFAQLFLHRLPLLSLLFYLGYLVVILVSSIFVIKIGLRLYDNEKIGSFDFLSFSTQLFFKFLLGYILYVLLVMVGFILLVVPGIYLAMKFQFVQYLIVDKNTNVIEAFKESSRMTDGHKWNLFLLLLLYMVIIFIGVMALGVGILIAIPIVMVAQAYVYKKLSLNPVTQSDILISDTGLVDNPFQSPGSGG